MSWTLTSDRKDLKMAKNKNKNTDEPKKAPKPTFVSKAKETRARSWRHTEEAKANGTHHTVKSRENNEVLAKLKERNFGFGQRAVRRILEGTRKNHGLTNQQISQLELVRNYRRWN